MTQEMITRRNLPHWYMPNAMHFVTFRLAGTIPGNVLERLHARKETLLSQRMPGESNADCRARAHKLLFAEYDRYLDNNKEIRWLGDPRVAAMLRRSLYYADGEKYRLLCWCIMPNHVHLLIRPFESDSSTDVTGESLDAGESDDCRSPLARIMQSLKGYTAHEANKLLGRSGQFWQHESYDHWVRDELELERIVAYINVNPVAARLASIPVQYPWSSAHDRYLYDGDDSGWLCVDPKDQADLFAGVLTKRSRQA